MTDQAWLDEPVGLTVPIRRMTDQGVERFRSYLTAAKAGANDPLPNDLLFNEDYARVLDISVTVEQGVFEISLDMARYLHPRIQGLALPGKYYDVGLWSWLSAFYLDSVCPANSSGRRKVGSIIRYVPPESRRFLDSIRHLMSMPVRMFDIHGEKRMRLFLYTRPQEISRYLSVVTESSELAANSGLLDALSILYWDEENQRPKRGALASRTTPGGLYRFMTVMNQFNRTYDLLSMTGKQIINLLPKSEFGRWLQK
jgi:hypothetical protein